MTNGKIKPPAKPKFPAGGLQALAPEALENESVYRGRILEGHSLTDSVLDSVSFEGCVFRDLNLNGTEWRRVRLADVRFEHCTFDGARWSEASLERAEFQDCRMLGLQAPGVRIRDVRLTRVQAPLSLWFRADTRKFWGEDCDLSEAVFQEAQLPGAVFRACRLAKTDFSGANLADADLRASALTGTRIGLRELADVTVEAVQLMELAYLLGVKVFEL
jgi:uncharacterized protein YjbI with pentapeptide repeats